MAAAVAAYDAGCRDILLIEREACLGGILNQCIHPGFGVDYFNEVLTGPEYAERFIEKVKMIPAIEVSLRSFVVRLSENKKLTYLKPGACVEVEAKAIIMATGCRERTREMIHIAGTRPAGIFSAGLAQKLINSEGLLPGKEVVIVGSGDIGLIMARRCMLEGLHVKAVVEIASASKGLKRNVVQCLDDFGIPLYVSHKIKCIYGQNRVNKVTVVKVDDAYREIDGTEFDIECDTVLISAGLIPENELIEMAGASLDARTNTPIAEKVNETSIPGLFACGNAFQVYDTVDAVTKDSEAAGKMAAVYLGG